MIDSFSKLPLWVSGGIIIGLLCLYSIAGLRVVRSFILPRLRVSGEDSEFTGAMVQAVMVFYGLAVALIAVSVWETHAEVSDVVSLEASRIGGLYRDVSGYPEPIRSELRDELRGYADYVITEAWPMLHRGEHPTRGVEWMNRFQESLCGFEPATDGQRALHSEALRAYNQLIEARRLRLDAMLVKLPPTLWIVIVCGAMISLAATFFFKVEDVRLHATQILLLAVFIGLVLMLILAFDRPFHGDLGLDPEPYQLVRDQLMND
jgi:hypothetical protein